MNRLTEVCEMINWCGYGYTFPQKKGNVIRINYPGIKKEEGKHAYGNLIRELQFDEEYIYLESYIFGVQPHKIHMKEVLKFYLDNPNYF